MRLLFDSFIAGNAGLMPGQASATVKHVGFGPGNNDMRRLGWVIGRWFLALCVALGLASGAGLIWKPRCLLYPRVASGSYASFAVSVSEGYLQVAYATRGDRMEILRDGDAEVMSDEKPWPSVSRHYPGVHYHRVEYHYPPVIMWRWLVTLWVPLAGACLPLGWVGWRKVAKRLRKADPKAVPCARCGYDLRGSPGRCPECGAERGGNAPG